MRTAPTERTRQAAIFLATVIVTYVVVTWLTGSTAEVIAR